MPYSLCFHVEVAALGLFLESHWSLSLEERHPTEKLEGRS